MELDTRTALDTLADAVVAANGTGAIVYVNRAAEQLLGYPPGELEGRPLTTVLPPRMHGAHNAGFKRFLSTRQSRLIGRAVRVPALRRDGTEVAIELTLSAFRVGEEDLFLASLRDMSDRVELERQLTISRYLRAATQAAARLTSRLDLDHVLQTVVETLVADFDSALARVWLYEQETNTLHLRASAGLSHATATSSRARIDVASYPYKVGEVARTGQRFIKNGLAGDPQFEQDWVEREKLASVAGFPLLVAGELRGVFISFSRRELQEEVIEVLGTFAAMVAAALNDAQLFLRVQEARTAAAAQSEELGVQREELEVANEELQSQAEELQATNQALKNQQEALWEADRRKADYLSMLAHELRNPLAPILNAAHLLKLSNISEPRIRRAQETIERQVLHQARLIDDLLSVTRLDHGKIVLRREPLDLAPLIRNTAEDCRALLEQAGLTFSVAIEEEPVPVECDPTRIAQVLDNLLQNAAKFTDSGGHVFLSLKVDEQQRQAVVTVQDTGIGIAPEVLPDIFDTFMQADRSLDRSRGGLGLGLALVRGLVRLHGGEVQAASDGPGHGAAFTIRLPLGVPSSAAEDAAPVGPAARTWRILVIEDNQDAAETLRELLEHAGHEVRVAYTGPAGVEAARSFQPEVVLCDLGLPGMDGYRVAVELRRDPATRPARMIAVSGYGEEEDRRRSREAGFDRHLTKPLATGELERILALEV